MTFLRSAAFGCALVLGAASAHAQSVVTRQIDNEPVETIVTRSPTGTVITRRPIAPAVAPAPAPAYDYGAYGSVAPQPYVAPVAPAVTATEVDDTVGLAPTELRALTVRRPAATRTSELATRATRVTHQAHAALTHTATRTVRHEARRIVAPPLVLAPAQRRVVYRTIVQQQVVPAVPVAPAGYPPYPAPAYQPRTVVVAPSATTGYGWTAPAADLDQDYVDTAPPVAPVYRTRVGAVLPASVVVTPLPATAAVQVPAVQPYSYATVDGRVLLVDPASNTVVADITP
jgi:hypothetical protein